MRGSKRVKPSLHITALLHQPAPVAAPRPPYPGPNRRTEEKEGKQTHRALLGCDDSSASSFPSDPSEAGPLTPWARTVDAEVPPTSAGRRGLLPAAERGSRLGPRLQGVGRPHRPPRLTLSPPSPEAIAQQDSSEGPALDSTLGWPRL